ncbi:MAG TPA: nickel pincer cofactor biosynthesis protein LarC [Chthoniobacterales bacterium]
MRTLFLDCFSGISGDMAVGALCDLGVEQTHLAQELAKLRLGDEFHLHFSRQSRRHIEGVKFDVHLHSHPHEGHSHEHAHEHPHDDPHSHGRSFADIRTLLEGSALSPFVKSRALAVFQRIAIAEGKIHGMPPADVHFHEVGAVDSIVDIVAFCVGVEALGAPRVLASSLFEGTGFIHCAHGHFPLPAPATLEILAGIPLRQVEEPMEFITPTGAALLAEFAEGFAPMPALAVTRIGYGVGTRDTPKRPNVLRAVLGETAEAPESDTVTEIETNLDDLPPELLAAATERLLEAGALDVFVAPISMKKNRPAFRLTVLAVPERADEFARLILRETSAFGVRMHDCRRLKLRREIAPVATPFGPIDIKRGWLGNELVQAAPEFESCRRAAVAAGASVREVYLAAQAAARD